jgi:hypothetical protein
MFDMKYLRIQGRDVAYRTGKPVGVFAAGWRLIRSGTLDADDERQFREIEKWFVDNLPEPPFYEDDNPGKPITYFKTETTALMMDKIKPILALFDKHGFVYDIVYTNHVGRIVYEDEYQVAVYDE